jgi:lysophospholipid acyltransferase (LPLAT)-like uncharacterized protein
MRFKPFFVFLFIRLLSLTYRYKIINQNALNEVKKQSIYGNYLFGLWHQNLIGSILSQIGNPHAVVVSPSEDGQLVAKTCEWLGHLTARGSSSRGGASALRAMIKYLKNGHPGAITVDGPQGPIYEPKKGIFELSYLTKVPVIPLTVLPTKKWVIKKAWDKFKIPKPFTSFYIYYGKPIYPSIEDKEHNFTESVQDLKHQLQHGEAYIAEMMKKNKK